MMIYYSIIYYILILIFLPITEVKRLHMGKKKEKTINARLLDKVYIVVKVNKKSVPSPGEFQGSPSMTAVVKEFRHQQ